MDIVDAKHNNELFWFCRGCLVLSFVYASIVRKLAVQGSQPMKNTAAPEH